MKWGEFLEVAGGNWGRPGAPQQHRQPLADPPSSDSTDPKISAFSVNGDIHLIEIKYCEDTQPLNRRNSWAPCRNNTKASAPSPREPPLSSTPSFWEWVAPSTTITRWIGLRSWVLILRELRNLLPSFMFICQLCCQTCPYQTCPFQQCDQLSWGDGFRSSLQPSRPPLTWWKSYTVPGTKVAFP